MYKVVIEKVQFGAHHSTDFEGEGATVQAALNRAKIAMWEEYPGGVQGYTYSTYKINPDTGDLKFLQKFSA